MARPVPAGEEGGGEGRDEFDLPAQTLIPRPCLPRPRETVRLFMCKSIFATRPLAGTREILN